MAKTEHSHKDIIDYYDKTRFDYRVAWDDSEHPAVHFGYYDEHADNHKDALMNTNRVLAEAAQIKAGDRVLDAGCGRGGSSFWLASKREVRAVGITPVQSQIDDCQAQAKELQLEDQVEFLLADYCHTPFEDASFDVVWACESLCHADQKADFYREAFRVLRPGGRLIIADYLRRERPLQPVNEKLLAAWLRSWAIPDIDSRSEHYDYAQQAGFQQIEIKDVTEQTQTSLRNLHRNSTNWLWLSHLMRFVRLRSGTQHRNMVGSIRQYEALEKGIWFYAHISARKG